MIDMYYFYHYLVENCLDFYLAGVYFYVVYLPRHVSFEIKIRFDIYVHTKLLLILIKFHL